MWSGFPSRAAEEAAPIRIEWTEKKSGAMPDELRMERKWPANQNLVAGLPNSVVKSGSDGEA